MTQRTGESAGVSRLREQLDRLIAEGCCPPGDMVVFPVSVNSVSLSDLARLPGVQIDRIGPDVVRVRRVDPSASTVETS